MMGGSKDSVNRRRTCTTIPVRCRVACGGLFSAHTASEMDSASHHDPDRSDGACRRDCSRVQRQLPEIQIGRRVRRSQRKVHTLLRRPVQKSWWLRLHREVRRRVPRLSGKSARGVRREDVPLPRRGGGVPQKCPEALQRRKVHLRNALLRHPDRGRLLGKRHCESERETKRQREKLIRAPVWHSSGTWPAPLREVSARSDVCSLRRMTTRYGVCSPQRCGGRDCASILLATALRHCSSSKKIAIARSFPI